MKLVNEYGHDLWQVDIRLTYEEYDLFRKVLEIQDWLNVSTVKWSSYYDKGFYHGYVITIWLFSHKDDATLFELTWG